MRGAAVLVICSVWTRSSCSTVLARFVYTSTALLLLAAGVDFVGAILEGLPEIARGQGDTAVDAEVRLQACGTCFQHV